MKSVDHLVVATVRAQGSDAILLTLALTPEQRPRFGHQPGQYLTLAVDTQHAEHWRCYSITSDPNQTDHIDVLVRRVQGGLVSNWLCDHAQPGLQLKVLPPAGRFTLADAAQPVLLYAGGSGIAPVYALARLALRQGCTDVRLFYANRNPETRMLNAELAALSAQYPGRFAVTDRYDIEHGLPDAAILAAHARDAGTAHAYLCGPEPYMRTAAEGLALAGVDASRIHREDFGATDDIQQDGATPADDEAQQASLTVRMRGQNHTVPVAPGQLLLAAMLEAGLPAPHACRVGECASCMCRLVDGEVQRLDSSVLDEDDIADGWLLACRSRAASPEVHVRFS